MGQRPARLAFGFLPLLLIAVFGCDRSTATPAIPATASTPASAPSSSSAGPTPTAASASAPTRAAATGATATGATAAGPAATVASLSPAATEILIGLGLGERLVAVSNFDRARDATRDLPRVGDYQTVDWERLATLRPSVMVTQFGPNRMPPGLKRKADDLDIRVVNVSITRLDDIYGAMTTLAESVGAAERGREATEALRARIAAVANRSTGRPVRTLIVLDDAARGVAGRGNYLDDVLSVAGGENVIRNAATPYPQIDREMLLALDPEVIVQLLPDASPQVRSAAGRVWQALPQLRAVQAGRVHVIQHSWPLSPTQHVAELAETFEKLMAEARGPARRPAAATTRTTSGNSRGTGAPPVPLRQPAAFFDELQRAADAARCTGEAPMPRDDRRHVHPVVAPSGASFPGPLS